MKKEHILVMVPTLTRWVTDSVACFFAEAVAKGYDDSYPAKFSCGVASKILGFAHVRNRIAQRFLLSPCDRLWMIDADTVLPEDIFELPKVDGDVVTLPYPFEGTGTPAILNYQDVNDFDSGLKDVEFGPDMIADVNGTGMGCTLIRRSVIEDPRMLYDTKYVRGDGKPMDLMDEMMAAPPIFRYHEKPNGAVSLGEDYDFCIRAKRLGYSIKIRMASQCGHLKTVDLNDMMGLAMRAMSEPNAAVYQERKDLVFV